MHQHHKMEETVEMVKEEEMPLPSYTWTHTDARLTNEEQIAIHNFINNEEKDCLISALAGSSKSTTILSTLS